MKCPVCQAKLLPVAGEMFCLQCGEAVDPNGEASSEAINLQDTRDPLLRKALLDATEGAMTFDDIPVPLVPEIKVREPVAVLPAKQGHTFSSLRSILAPPKPVAATGVFASVPSLASTNVAIDPPIPDSQPARVAPRRHFRLDAMASAWAIGLVGLVLFVGVNLLIGNYFTNRIYFGAKVGSLSVGGWTFAELDQRLPGALAKPSIVALVGDRKYPIDSIQLGSVNFQDLEKGLKDMGRNTSLPLVGFITAALSAPVQVNYQVSDTAAASASAELSALVYRQASNAAAMIVGSNVLVLADKPGAALDPVATAAALKASYGRVDTVTLEPVRVVANIPALSYASDAATAQSIMGLPVQIVVGKTTYTPTADQIGSWLVFGKPGSGIGVNAAGVATYVAGIPGSFDRGAAVSGVTAELNAHKGGAVAPSTVRPTANPTPVSTAASLPVISYTYCVDESQAVGAGLSTQSVTTLAQSNGWTLGGRIQFTRATAGCNFVLTLANAQALRVLDPDCATQTACRIHNDLAISEASWRAAPSGWAGDINTYRSELINHVVGQWLGFDHPACSAVATKTPVLSMPSVIIAGCSPKWYAVPAELQDTKVLGGF